MCVCVCVYPTACIYMYIYIYIYIYELTDTEKHFAIFVTMLFEGFHVPFVLLFSKIETEFLLKLNVCIFGEFINCFHFPVFSRFSCNVRILYLILTTLDRLLGFGLFSLLNSKFKLRGLSNANSSM